MRTMEVLVEEYTVKGVVAKYIRCSRKVHKMAAAPVHLFDLVVATKCVHRVDTGTDVNVTTSLANVRDRLSLMRCCRLGEFIYSPITQT